MTYAEYLESPHWLRLRAQKLDEIGRVCEQCDSGYRLEVHHQLYRRSWFDTALSDLRVLCSYCHKREHGLIRPTESKRERDRFVRAFVEPHKPIRYMRGMYETGQHDTAAKQMVSDKELARQRRLKNRELLRERRKAEKERNKSSFKFSYPLTG